MTIPSSDPATLSGRLRDVWQAIHDYYREHGLEPTVREVGMRCGISPPNNAVRFINALKESGHYAAAVDPRCRVVGEREFPFYGHVCAGDGLPSSEPDEKRLNLGKMFSHPDLFALRVRGESMIDSLVAPGDYVLVRPEKDLRSGMTVIVRINDEFVMKSYRVVDGRVWLYPKNRRMKRREVKPGDEAQIIGIVVGVVRKG